VRSISSRGGFAPTSTAISMLLFALVRAIEIVGEAANKISDEARAALPAIPWPAIVGMRNRLIHAYFEVDPQLVWQTATVEQPGALLPDTQDPRAEYHANTTVIATVNRQLGDTRIRSAADLAAATRYLYKSAVERFDAIVTDRAGKPLAVVGSFNGALAQTSVYPATVVAEAIRVPGAAQSWFSHNHPSGTAALSMAYRMLHGSMIEAFTGTHGDRQLRQRDGQAQGQRRRGNGAAGGCDAHAPENRRCRSAAGRSRALAARGGSAQPRGPAPQPAAEPAQPAVPAEPSADIAKEITSAFFAGDEEKAQELLRKALDSRPSTPTATALPPVDVLGGRWIGESRSKVH